MHKKYSSSSHRWLNEHFQDKFVKLAHKNNLRSRAWFKLHEINMKYSLFKHGMNIVDLGSAPGSWSQYAMKQIGKTGCVIACDINTIKPIPGVIFFQLNILKTEKFYFKLNTINKKNINLVMSDMAPNITGISSIDIPNICYLSNIAFKISKNILSHNGIFLVKVFQNTQIKKFIQKISIYFHTVKICKPNASRSRSSEIFILAKGFKNNV